MKLCFNFQPSTFTLPAPEKAEICECLWDGHRFIIPEYINGLPEVPIRAVHHLDGYCNSALMLLYSNHLGVERLVPYAKMMFPADCKDEDGNDDEEKARETARWMGDGNAAYKNAVTSPVPPEIMKLEPGEAAFNIEKYADTVKALLSNGIITDTGKQVKLGYYPKFPICRIHAPQTDNAKEVEERSKERQAIMERIMGTEGITWIDLSSED